MFHMREMSFLEKQREDRTDLNNAARLRIEYGLDQAEKLGELLH